MHWTRSRKAEEIPELEKARVKLDKLTGRKTYFDLQFQQDNYAVVVYAKTTTSDGGRSIGHFQLNQYPHNCGLVLLSNLHSYRYFHGTPGVGSFLLDLAKEMCGKWMGYTSMQMTVPSDWNAVGFFERRGFKEFASFDNRRSGNTIKVMSFELDNDSYYGDADDDDEDEEEFFDDDY